MNIYAIRQITQDGDCNTSVRIYGEVFRDKAKCSEQMEHIAGVKRAEGFVVRESRVVPDGLEYILLCQGKYLSINLEMITLHLRE